MAYPYQIDVLGTRFDNLPYPYAHPVTLRDNVLYKMLIGDNSPGGDLHLNMWKSTDAGVTWAAPDTSTNRPFPNGGSPGGNFRYYVTYEADDSEKLWVTYVPGSDGTLPASSHLQYFDTVTDTWGAPITGGPLPLVPIGSGTLSASPTTPNNQVQLGINVRSNGDKVVIFSAVTTATDNFIYQDLKFVVYNGGWGTDTFNLLRQGVTDDTLMSFSYLGSVVGASDRIHVFSWTQYGYAYATIMSDNSVENYRRFDNDTLDFNFWKDGGVYGLPKMIAFGTTSYAVLPHAILRSTIDGTSVSSRYRPSLLMIPDSDTPSHARYDSFDDYMIGENINWCPVAVAYDASTGSTYLSWVVIDDPATSYVSKIRISCTKGFAWSDPSTIFTSPNSDDLIETMESEASNGTLRLVFENSAGEGDYLWANYWQGSVSCSAPGCPPAGGTSNKAYIS